MKELFVLGAHDPEMVRIIALLEGAGKNFIYAKKDGERVRSGTAYEANNKDEIPDTVRVIFVECEVAGVMPSFRIDHHRPGDPGYDKRPEEYLLGSSLGQLCAYLERTPTEEDTVIAAMDHCFHAAVKGLCPGVSPSAVLKMKIEKIAEGYNCSTKEVEKEIRRFQEIISTSETILIGDQSVHDVIGSLGVGYTLQLLTALTAATIERKAVLLHAFDTKGGPEKLILGGDVHEKTVRYFMQIWAPANSLEKIFGTPSRGYAGGYRK
ncbi:MAG: hypothetical protein HYT93_00720 [Parcubacteria group bacterium]|nr:hypothetical protein [Parcubacteria group bacterium]